MSGHRKWADTKRERWRRDARGKELEPRCTWPEHFYWGGDGWYDMEEKGCPECFWWTLCYFLALADVHVQPPMARCDYT